MYRDNTTHIETMELRPTAPLLPVFKLNGFFARQVAQLPALVLWQSSLYSALGLWLVLPSALIAVLDVADLWYFRSARWSLHPSWVLLHIGIAVLSVAFVVAGLWIGGLRRFHIDREYVTEQGKWRWRILWIEPLSAYEGVWAHATGGRSPSLQYWLRHTRNRSYDVPITPIRRFPAKTATSLDVEGKVLAKAVGMPYLGLR